jgi:transcriptional regulator with GAF, ATPase, and Fis domain
MLADDNRYLQQELLRLSGEDIVGADFGLRGVMEMVRQVAPLDSPVLLLGETGVGKDVIANAIHYSSLRREHPFITVNSGAIPENLLDSELFGHEKGAFTGAIAQKRGRFERANKGTIFLDEIGELPPQAQVRMLRVLQHKEIERVGGSNPIHVDVRIIAATHRNLEEMLKADLFREDLWFRLNVFPIMIPPLRARKADIPALLHHFIQRKTIELKLPTRPTLAPGAMDRLVAYHWPGNVRELENMVERALILNRSGPVEFAFHDSAGHEDVCELSEDPFGSKEALLLDQAIRRHIQKVLKIADGKIHGPGGAAELMGINPSTLRNRMNKLAIPYGRGKSGVIRADHQGS